MLPHSASLTFENLDSDKRSLAATADFMEIFGVQSIPIEEDGKHSVELLFDLNHSLEERIVAEQFTF